jgi:hypothetical protein
MYVEPSPASLGLNLACPVTASDPEASITDAYELLVLEVQI